MFIHVVLIFIGDFIRCWMFHDVEEVFDALTIRWFLIYTYLIKWTPREALKALQIQTFGSIIWLILQIIGDQIRNLHLILNPNYIEYF